jgi:DNA-binding GntR family transcriptional regulator
MVDESMQVYAVAAPVRQKVFETLRGAITSGRFRPGQRLIEKELCDLMGVSRPPVREALRHLESEGLVETIPNRGPIVTRVRYEHAVSIYQVRASLEALAAELFATNATDDDLRRLQQALDELIAAMLGKNLEKVIEKKDQFYSALFAGSGNVMIGMILRTMNARVTFLRRISLSSPDRGAQTIRELQAALVALARRDGTTASEAMRTHVVEASKVALASLSAQEAGEAGAS